MKRILFISYSNPYSKNGPGGILSYIIKMAALLEKHGFIVHVLSVDKHSNTYNISDNIVNITIKEKKSIIIKLACKLIKCLTNKRHASLPMDLLNSYCIKKNIKNLKKLIAIVLSKYQIIN